MAGVASGRSVVDVSQSENSEAKMILLAVQLKVSTLSHEGRFDIEAAPGLLFVVLVASALWVRSVWVLVDLDQVRLAFATWSVIDGEDSPVWIIRISNDNHGAQIVIQGWLRVGLAWSSALSGSLSAGLILVEAHLGVDITSAPVGGHLVVPVGVAIELTTVVEELLFLSIGDAEVEVLALEVLELVQSAAVLVDGLSIDSLSVTTSETDGLGVLIVASWAW